jgi:4-amino-4-deoxy-L-arabinose transferase-like glycosyltransferase
MQTIRARFNKYTWAFLLVIAGIGIVLDLYIIRNGVGATGDAVWYMQGAENILKGYGYGILRGDGFKPTTMFPPFYSIFLAGFGWFGIPIFNIAGVLNAILLAANIFLTGWIIHRLSGSGVASILASAFTLLCFPFFILHTWAMSEPLYITLTLLSLISIYYYQMSGKRFILIFAGLISGLAVITRLVGISLVATICLWVLIFGKGSLKKRILDILIVGFIGILPLAISFIRNALVTNSIAGRSAIVFHSVPFENYASLMQTFISWFFPGIDILQQGNIYKIVFVGLILILAILFFFSVLYKSNKSDVTFRRNYIEYEYLALIYLVVYVFTFMGSIYLSLAGDPSNWALTAISRYLTPIFPIFVVLVILVILQIQNIEFFSGKIKPIVILGLAFTILIIYSYNFSIILINRGFNRGYTDIKIGTPSLVAELQSIESTRPLIASNYELISFLAERPVYSMPGQGDELTGIANPEFTTLFNTITALIDKGAILVIYRSTPDQRFYYDDLINKLTLLNIYRYGDSSISLYSLSGLGK